MFLCIFLLLNNRPGDHVDMLEVSCVISVVLKHPTAADKLPGTQSAADLG